MLKCRTLIGLSLALVAIGTAHPSGRPQEQGAAPKGHDHVLTAGEGGVPAGIDWPSPELGPGPFLIESAIPEQRHLRVVVVARGLEQPWSMAWMPDGSLLVTERPGRLRIIRNDTLDPTPIAGVPRVHAAGLQGLQDVALHPQFAQNHYVYLTYHKPVRAPATSTATRPTATNAGAVQPANPAPEEAGATTVARGVWNGTALTDVKDIFETGATGTEASRLAFGRDGMLYVSVSAPGTSPEVIRSQDPNDYAGKTLRLKDDGSVPADNPFVHRAGYKPAIFTLGHRNGHSMAINPETGEIWMTEQGPHGGDEINVLKPGANYGWPFVSYGRNYEGKRISEDPARDGMEPPVVVWIPSIAVTGGTFYTGNVFTGWKRNFFVGGLREGEIPRTGHVERIEFNARWEEIRRESLLRELHQRIRDVRQGPDGFLYVLTAENAGALLRIEPAGPANR
jgi:glucose/arabinose dehydrogenase